MNDQIPKKVHIKLSHAMSLIDEYAQLVYDVGNLAVDRDIVLGDAPVEVPPVDPSNNPRYQKCKDWLEWHRRFQDPKTRLDAVEYPPTRAEHKGELDARLSRQVT